MRRCCTARPASDVEVVRDGAIVEDCTGAPGTASPNPCVSGRADLPNGNVQFTVLTSNASIWSFGVAPSAVQGPAVYAGSTTIVRSTNGKATKLQIPVTLSEPLTTTVTVHYAVTSGTATAGVDFTAKSGKLVFKPNAKTGITPTVKFITVNVTSSVYAPGPETLILMLSDPSPGLSIGYATGIGTIVSTFGTQIGVGDVSVYEGDSGGPQTIKVPITRSDAGGNASVHYTISPLTVDGSDYTTPKVTGTVSFSAGQDQKSITIKVNADTDVEADEALQIVLSSPIGGDLGRGAGQLTILNDD